MCIMRIYLLSYIVYIIRYLCLCVDVVRILSCIVWVGPLIYNCSPT